MSINEFQGTYRFLSNFWPARVRYLDREYPTVENAYQAAKCDTPTERIPFETCFAGKAKKMGRSIKIRPDWNQVKDAVMLNLLRQKFQNPELREKLLYTGKSELIEGNYWGDTYWGVCRGVGENRLGKLLMLVREESAKSALNEKVKG
jgi:ribA/ribD-fused uncharacterized protein